jgi:hypothetical protein
MAQITVPMRKSISSLILQVRKTRIALQEQLLAATTEGRKEDKKALAAEESRLEKEFARTGQMEIDFLASDLDPSEAEKELTKAVAEGNKLVTNLRTVAKVLEAAAGLASMIARLATLLK